jgi:hypothetical protein
MTCNYVIVHELLHVSVPNRGNLWKSLVRAYLGDYEILEARLNRGASLTKTLPPSDRVRSAKRSRVLQTELTVVSSPNAAKTIDLVCVICIHPALICGLTSSRPFVETSQQ